MKTLLILASLLLVATPALAQRKPCDELKSEIQAKIQAKGVTAFTLDIVPNEEVKEGSGKVVGTCDGSTRKIVYMRGGSEAPAAAPAPAPAPAPAAAPAAPAPQSK